MNFWLIKQEPEAFSWADFLREGKAVWDGVRNYQARNNLASMRKGDFVLFYHSVTGKEVVGIALVDVEAYPDPSTDDARWLAVDFIPHKTLTKPVPLSAIKAEPNLANIALLRQSRLSVMPLTPEEFRNILHLSQTEL